MLSVMALGLFPVVRDQLRKYPRLAGALFYLALALMIAFMFMGCGLLPEKPNADAIYAHTLRVDVNGHLIQGMGVTRNTLDLNLKIYPEGKVDRLILRTCHREIVIDSPDKSFFKIYHEVTLKRQAGVEDVAACALEIDAFEERKKRNGWAIIDFNDARPHVVLPSKVNCNGEEWTYPKGASVCQSAIGLVAVIRFETEVLVSPDAGCDALTTVDRKTYRIIMPKGKCTYYFRAREKAENGERLTHRLNTLGYTDVPPVK
jgi:hypothetical protein